MQRISYLNGQFLPHEKCLVHIEDRGFQFADGIYEVILFHNNKLIDCNWHLDRLFRSLSAIEIKFEKNREEITDIILELFKQNNLTSGSIYLQITRGNFPRTQGLPSNITPTISATVSALKTSNPISATFCEDIRWQRCDIKSIGLLASSIARQKAIDLGFDDAILIKNNYVSEMSFANIFMIDDYNQIITCGTENNILAGITRQRVIELAKENGLKVLIKNFTKEELLNAKEVFATSSTLLIRPIVKIDDKKFLVGNITQQLTKAYNKFIDS